MKLDINTIAFITSLIFATQTIAVFAQYLVNKTVKGLEWWLAGAIFQALGFFSVLALNYPSIWMLSAFANPLIYTGQLFLNTALVKFFGKKESRWPSVLLFTFFVLAYSYFILTRSSITARSLLIASFATILFIKMACTVFHECKPHFSGSAVFEASILMAYGVFQALLAVMTFFLPTLYSYDQFYQVPIRIVTFILPIVGSMLWTFGFIIMLNQRLNAEILEKKEKMQRVFNTSPDAQLISRLSDSYLVDINNGFLDITGFTRDELKGKSTSDIGVWVRPEDQKNFIKEVQANGCIKNRTFDFRRKDGSLFKGMISANLITIHEQMHIISTVHDITDRDKAEQTIQDLVKQLEIEKNVAETNAITDSLTGLLNRRFFDDTLKTEFFRLKRSGAPLSLIMFDIDRFKNFNDTYGHLAGDTCLRQIGTVLKAEVKRLHDIVARYGGEEFVVIMPETDPHGAATLAEQIRKKVEELAIPHSASDVSPYVTISLGVVTVHSTELSESEQVIALADKALYQAKQDGRNRVVISDQ